MKTPGRLVTQTPDGAFHYQEGAWFPAWALLMVPFILWGFLLRRFVGRAMSWIAALLTVAVFEAVCMPAESHSLKRGHWVYNESRILGPKIFGVPIEEPLLYYLFSPLIIILIFHRFLKHYQEKKLVEECAR